ncbi:NTP transferase domain-containing protein, partial [Myceligenerans cantabricum]
MNEGRPGVGPATGAGGQENADEPGSAFPRPGGTASTGALHDAIVLAGGRASRLDGAAKPALVSDGVPLLHLALDAAGGARRTAVVGPDDLAAPIAAHPTAHRTVLTREDPPFGGPAAAIAAALKTLTPHPHHPPHSPPPQ